MRPPVQHIAPAKLPVTDEELRRYCRVEGTGEDEHLRRLAASAVARLDGYAGLLGRAIITQTWRQGFNAFPRWPYESKLRLKLPDVAKATVILFDLSANEAPQPEGRYILDRDMIGWFITPQRGRAWPSGPGIVEFECGYGPEPENVNEAVREAICMMVQTAYRMTSADAALRSEAVEGANSYGYFGPEIMGNASAAHVQELIRHARWRPV